MTDLNKQELRRLAEALPHKDWYAGNAYGKKFIADYQVIAPTPEGNYVLLEGNQNFLDHAVANVAFVGACSPSAVLALLDEIDLLRHGVKGDFDLDAWLEWAKEAARLRQDAERYRALREMNWCDGPLAVVADPYSRIKLGSDCPSHERLDQVVDSFMAKAASADAGVVDYD